MRGGGGALHGGAGAHARTGRRCGAGCVGRGGGAGHRRVRGPDGGDPAHRSGRATGDGQARPRRAEPDGRAGPRRPRKYGMPPAAARSPPSRHAGRPGGISGAGAGGPSSRRLVRGTPDGRARRRTAPGISPGPGRTPGVRPRSGSGRSPVGGCGRHDRHTSYERSPGNDRLTAGVGGRTTGLSTARWTAAGDEERTVGESVSVRPRGRGASSSTPPRGVVTTGIDAGGPYGGRSRTGFRRPGLPLPRILPTGNLRCPVGRCPVRGPVSRSVRPLQPQRPQQQRPPGGVRGLRGGSAGDTAYQAGRSGGQQRMPEAAVERRVLPGPARSPRSGWCARPRRRCRHAGRRSSGPARRPW
ncbi:hypothetical protein SHIRM173S_03745 [Streptomyces hirsutus]